MTLLFFVGELGVGDQTDEVSHPSSKNALDGWGTRCCAEASLFGVLVAEFGLATDHGDGYAFDVDLLDVGADV